ncbi:hypothetical protein PVAP13_9NG370928 [Panicum virgatum]|uniref:Uncharacterized protein n=1 Tax=Panicum virgatum TaxID=38727 RepID=A0A8T0MP59_PANVG|nr:hypothetical protein PVAP13_9NG370928 [Panicum virgatum]
MPCKDLSPSCWLKVYIYHHLCDEYGFPPSTVAMTMSLLQAIARQWQKAKS